VVLDVRCQTKVDCGGCSNGGICGAQAQTPNACGPAPIQIDAGSPVVLASNQDSPTFIAVDARNVYWTNAGTGSNGVATVMSLPIAGGNPLAFEKGGTAYGVTAAGGRVYSILTTSSEVELFSAGAGGIGPIEELWIDPSGGPCAGPVASATSLYWSDGTEGNIWQMGFDGSNGRVLASGETQPGALAVDTKYVYWMAQQGIRRMPLDGGPVTTLGTPPSGPPLVGLAIAVDSTGVYSNPVIVPLCVPWRTSLSGGASQPIAQPQVSCVPTPLGGRGVGTDGSNVYWTIPLISDPQSGGAVFRAPVSGGGPTTIASDQGFPWAVALDSRFVYWTNHGGINGGAGQVMMAPK
jgi:hypothetical protein